MGTGDGSYVIKQARKFPNTFFIGIDTNTENLDHSSRQTAFFSEKKGLRNALFVRAGVENLPLELSGLASSLTVLLPWGSLLKTVAKPDLTLVAELRRLCAEKASLQVVFGYEAATEQKVIEELGLPETTSTHLDKLITLYSEVGFQSLSWKMLSQEELKAIPTTWAKKLAYGKKRQFVEIRGVINVKG